ncbi:MAG: AAA family ATPase [Candidatus Sericytochromatia bacterium]|nr:AAA family ATPase [Candidatus Sericytochromatia bacterium]
MRRHRIKDDCEIWLEPWLGSPSIIVNSVGGGRERIEGLAVLLASLARSGHQAVEVGYHPSGKEYQKLPDVPLDETSTLAQPVEAAKALCRAAARVEGGNYGSRLRLVLPTAGMDKIEALIATIGTPAEDTRRTTEAPGVKVEKPQSGRQIVDHVLRSLQAEGLAFRREQVADFYLAVRTKPFVLLAGISGTGKSILARRFADACDFPAPLIAVRPDWSDPSELLGYRDLKGAFVPGRLIPHIVAATEQADRPYFLVLDEMNLARVEHYFADLLSIMETRRLRGNSIETDTICLDIGADTRLRCEATLAARIKAVLVDGGLRLPPNLCIVGTVNMDESTHPFSKKVLDRAMTLEFVATDLTEVPVRQELPPPLSVNSEELDAPLIALSQIHQGSEMFFADAIQLLVDLNVHLARASLQVGYRTRDEVCIYLHHNREQNLLNPSDALDLALYHKVLPRIQGGEEIREPLAAIKSLLDRKGLGRCVAKIAEMQQRLEQAGFTAFWA